MQKLRSLSIAFLALIATLAQAQFNGPAPLAWRWLPTSGVASSGAPLAVGDTIYISCGGRLYALDRVTGNRKWQFPLEDQIPGVFPHPPILVDGVLVATGSNKIVYGVDPKNGQALWSFVLTAPASGQPVQVGKFVIQALSSSQLAAIDPTTGQSVWKGSDGDTQVYTISDKLTGQVAGYGDSLYYFTLKNELHNLNVITRTEDAWAQPIRFTTVDESSVPVLFSDTMYVASGQFLAAINPVTGVVAWQTPTGFQTAFSPIVSTQGVFVCSRNGDAMLFDLALGQPTSGMPKPISLGSAPATRPSVVGDKFIVPTTSGALDLIDPTNGQILWSYTIRPTVKIYEKKTSTQGGASGAPGGGGGFGGRGGAGQGFKGGGGGRGGQGQNTPKEITEIEASGPAVLDGQTLLVPARDSSLMAFDSTLGVDLTPPSAKMLFPTPGEQICGLPPLLLYFKVRDDGSGVKDDTLKISIDGKPYDYEYKRDGSAKVVFTISGKNKCLADGRHLILVEVSDWLGNVAHETFSLTIDNTLPPIKLPGQPTQTNPNGGPGGPGGGGESGGGQGGGGLGGGGAGD